MKHRFVPAVLVASSFVHAPLAPAQVNSLESRASDGTQANDNSTLLPTGRALSTDGRYVVFTSRATNLAGTDNNGWTDVFLRDRSSGTTICLSSNGSTTGNRASDDPSITPDGRWVVFGSWSSDLVANDKNGAKDIFRWDTTTNTLDRVSVPSGGGEANNDSGYPSLTPDGRYLVFASRATNLDAADTNSGFDVYVRDLQNDTVAVVSTSTAGVLGNGWSYEPTISDDGRWVAFRSAATNLAGTDAGQFDDVFLKDLQTGVLVRMSNSTSGGESNGDSVTPHVCGDGHLVFYVTAANNIVAHDTNGGNPDVLVYDVAAGTNAFVDVSATGKLSDQGAIDPSPSRDGRYCAFSSYATNLDPLFTKYTTQHVFVRDLVQNRCVAEDLDASFALATGFSGQPSLSDDGELVAFLSYGQNLVSGDTSSAIYDVFLRDRGETRFVEYGVGLAGTGGYVPHLGGSDGREALGDLVVRMDGGLGAASGILFVGVNAADLFPVFGGHFYIDLTAGWTRFPLALGGAAGVGGTGALALPGVDVSAFDGTTFYLQLLLADPAAVRGVSMSNGLEMHVGN